MAPRDRCSQSLEDTDGFSLFREQGGTVCEHFQMKVQGKHVIYERVHLYAQCRLGGGAKPVKLGRRTRLDGFRSSTVVRRAIAAIRT
jgi:hypothetical protein